MSTWTSIGSLYLFAPNTINPLWRDAASSFFCRVYRELSSFHGPTSCATRLTWFTTDLHFIFNLFTPWHGDPPTLFLCYLYFHQCDPLHSTKWLNRTREENRRSTFANDLSKKKQGQYCRFFVEIWRNAARMHALPCLGTYCSVTITTLGVPDCIFCYVTNQGNYSKLSCSKFSKKSTKLTTGQRNWFIFYYKKMYKMQIVCKNTKYPE